MVKGEPRGGEKGGELAGFSQQSEGEQTLLLVPEVITEEERACPSSVEGGNRWKITSGAWRVHGGDATQDSQGSDQFVMAMEVTQERHTHLRKTQTSSKRAGGQQAELICLPCFFI